MMERVAKELGVPFKRIGSLALAFNEEDMSKNPGTLPTRAEQWRGEAVNAKRIPGALKNSDLEF